MKVAPLLVIFYIALAGIIIFDGLMVGDMGWSATPYQRSEPLETNRIWDLFTNPTNWIENPFIAFITITFLTAGASIAVAVLTKSDIALLLPIFVMIINAGILPLIAIYNVVNREVIRMVCTGTLNSPDLLVVCSADQKTAAILLVAIIVGPLAIAWTLACIEWWTQRQTS